jgi:hypothetical protein
MKNPGHSFTSIGVVVCLPVLEGGPAPLLEPQALLYKHMQ